MQGAGAPEDHYIIPPVFIGFADAFIYLRDNKRFDEEVHKILARTVSYSTLGLQHFQPCGVLSFRFWGMYTTQCIVQQ
jgi:hypothetical protein